MESAVDTSALAALPTRRSSDLADWQLHSTVWFHAVNVIWHGIASVLVAGIAGDWIGTGEEGSGKRAALVAGDRKSTRLNSSHASISYAVFCLKKKKGRLRWAVG